MNLIRIGTEQIIIESFILLDCLLLNDFVEDKTQ